MHKLCVVPVKNRCHGRSGGCMTKKANSHNKGDGTKKCISDRLKAIIERERKSYCKSRMAFNNPAVHSFLFAGWKQR